MKYNYKYAKLDDTKLVYAPNILTVGKEQIINAGEEAYAGNGFLPIVKTDMPETKEGFYYIPAYSVQDGKFVQVWEEHEVPQTDEATEAEKAAAYDILMGVSE